MRGFVARVAKQHLSRAFEQWQATAATMLNEKRRLMRAVVVIQSSHLAAAWCTWREIAHFGRSMRKFATRMLALKKLHAWRKWHLYLRRATLGKHLLTEAELHHVKGVWREWQARFLSRERRFAAIWEAMGKKRTPTLPSRHLILIRTPT